MNEYSLPFCYFNEMVEVKIPSNCFAGTLEASFPDVLKDTELAVKNSLDKPVGTPPLSSTLKRGDSVVIIIPDRTRPLPLRPILSTLVSYLLNCGIHSTDILAVIATGTHRAMTQQEIEQEVGMDMLKTVQVVNHNWRDQSNLVDLGQTDSGVPIQVSRKVYEADKVIGIGTVKPHQIAGWSGGAKCIQPGVCGKETTEKTHWVFANIPKNLIIGNVAAQPRKEMEKVAKQVGLDFVINVVLDRNKELSYIRSGDFIEAHRNCVRFASPFFTMGFNQQANVVICGSGTWASNLWLASGTASYADLFIKDGGTLIILASCPEGLDPEHPVIGEYGFRSYEEIAELVEQGKITDLVGATHMTQLGNMIFKRDIDCVLVSKGISEELVAKLNCTYAKSPQDAVEIALKKHGTNNTAIYAMPGRVPGGILPGGTNSGNTDHEMLPNIQ